MKKNNAATTGSKLTAFIVTVSHDKGTSKIRVNAMNEDSAKYLVQMAEGCPESAITKVREARYNKK